ncbi:MAG: hypothetical protein KGD64_11570 [Candidatus Heimdallarchaeota archaeon]|nr:hypothetical protein [Candidatus Heimdallarchaeota archaeon]
MSEFDLPWNKFVGFSLFTLDEDMIFDKVINQKTAFSTVFQVIDTGAKTREELRRSQTITLKNEMFRVDYHLFFNIILSCMFLPEIEEQQAEKINDIIKSKLKEQLQDYGAIDKMEPQSQTALIKRLGSLISDRAASQIKYDFYPTKKPQQVESQAIEQVKEVVEVSTPVEKTQESTQGYTQPTTKPASSSTVSSTNTTNVEGLLEFIGHKTGQDISVKSNKVELTQQLLEETKRLSVERVLSSIVKGLSSKTGVCFVFTGDKGTLETITFGMSEKHGEFVLGILSKYPEVVKQTLESESEEKTLDAGDGVVILEESTNGILVSITKNREEIPIIAKRMKLVNTMISEFLITTY